MSAQYVPIQWNIQKKRYDAYFMLLILLFITLYTLINKWLYPQLIWPTIIIRCFGLLSILLLHLILAIGPLSRIHVRFLPLLYNRRHLGVMMFFTSSVHAVYSLLWFHGGGNVHPLISLFTSNLHYDSLLFFPFQTLGFLAYLILMLMAFISHDFWLAILTPRIWKWLHMLVYLAYALLMMHVVLGVVQLENNIFFFGGLLAGLVVLCLLHLLAAKKERQLDRKEKKLDEQGWVYVCKVEEIASDRAKMVDVDGERIAVFKYDGKLSAVHNVCKHQQGPLGEGKIIDGCITCPWHGYQYHPHDGCSPAPFTEKLATYALKLYENKIWVNPKAFPEGTQVEPCWLEAINESGRKQDPFYVGWSNTSSLIFQKSLLYFVAVAMCLSFVMIGLFSFHQEHLANSSFNYENVKRLSGSVGIEPFAHITVLAGRKPDGGPLLKVFPLVNANKFGASATINRWLHSNGSIKSAMADIDVLTLHRDGVFALQLNEDGASLRKSKEQLAIGDEKIQSLGDTLLTGEIIDPKCYLGAMNPGEGKPHRSCAIRCISGGIMPMLTWVNGNKREYAVLTGPHGRPINKEVLFAVAEPVRVRGNLFTLENWKWFEIEPSAIERLIPY